MIATVLTLLLLAQDLDGPELDEAVDTETIEDDFAGTSTTSLEYKVHQQGIELEILRARLDNQQEAELRSTDRLQLSGYFDVGLFVPSGNGSGVVQDFGGVYAPGLGTRWVFLGDVLSTAVNGRGEAADLGDLPGAERFDSVHSGGAFGFLINEVNLTARYTLLPELHAMASLNFVPRSGADFGLGDFFDLDLCQIEWRPFGRDRFELFVGKVDSVLGVEYKERKPTKRFGITPSLAARYTVGTPLGLKARAVLFDRWVILAAALSNGSSGVEQFHFYDEVDHNDGKTLSGRAALRLPIRDYFEGLAGSLEIGLSGSFGPQDIARDTSDAAWFAGVDLEYSGTVIELRGQWMKGKVPGRAVDEAFSLDLRGVAYLEVHYRILENVGLLLRAELRDATIELGNERAYLAKTWRVTGGVRYKVTPELVVKAEYLRNEELGPIPNIDNDVFTMSAVVEIPSLFSEATY